MKFGKRKVLITLRGVKRMDEAKLERIYHQIAQTIVEMIPEEWEKVYLYGEVLEGVQSTYFYYYPYESDQPIYSLDIPELFDVEEEEYDQLKGQLYDLLRDLWNESKRDGNEVWTNLTLILDSSGKFKLEYGYEDLSETDHFVRSMIWRYNKLGILPKGDYATKILKEHLQDKNE